jgi:hypothetical protein
VEIDRKRFLSFLLKVEESVEKETAMHDPSIILAARLSYRRPVAFRPTVFGGLAFSGC